MKTINLTNVFQVAKDLFALHGISNWEFRLDNAKQRAGLCDFYKKRISLSKYYLESSDDDFVLDTIKHEIAHALAGPKAGHGPLWKAKCLEVGAKPQRCFTQELNSAPPGGITFACPGCALSVVLYRPRRNRDYNCRKCGPVKGRLKRV